MEDNACAMSCKTLHLHSHREEVLHGKSLSLLQPIVTSVSALVMLYFSFMSLSI
jgi:hypothetical protein